jgi:hypothetical protein
MAKTQKPTETSAPAKGFVRLEKTGADGGYMDYPEKDVKRLLSLEKKLGVENYVLPAANGDSDSGQDQSGMGEAEK